MKFFYALKPRINFVLSSAKLNHTKQIIPHNPDKYTQPTLLHQRVNMHRLGSHKTRSFNQYYMYICSLFNSPKRSREIFAMQDYWVILMHLGSVLIGRFWSEETTLKNHEYTLIHLKEKRI